MNTPAKFASKAYFKQLFVTHIALVVGLVIFSLLALFVVLSDFVETAITSPNLQYIIIGIAVGGVTASYYAFKYTLKKIDSTLPLETKMNEYRKSLLVRYAYLEASAILIIIGTLMSNNASFLIVSALVTIIFFLARPTEQSAIKDLALDQQEIAMFEN